MKTINVRYLDHNGDTTLAMTIAEAVEAILKAYFTQRRRPYLGTQAFHLTATSEHDTAKALSDAARLREALETMPDGVTVTLGSDVIGGVEIDPADLAKIVSTAVAEALKKAGVTAEEEEDDELDEETQQLLNDIEEFEETFFSPDSRDIVLKAEVLDDPVSFLEFTTVLGTYLRNISIANEKLGCSYFDSVVIKRQQ